MAAALAVLGLTVYVSVAAQQDVFTYFKPDSNRRADDEDCRICYGENDCLSMNQARCEFYIVTSEMLVDDESPAESTNPELKIQVDSLMMGMAEQSNLLAPSQDCVPFISEYTDCTKENICLGCHSCACDEAGRWNCSSVRRCRPEQPLEVDHRALVIAVETLRGDGNPSFRLKRSITNTSTSSVPKQKITFEELTEWLYGVQPLKYKEYARSSITTEASVVDRTTEGKVDVLTTVSEDTTTSKNNEIINMVPDYVVFDDVLHDVAIEGKNYSRRKPLNTTHDDTLEHDYMKLDDLNITVEDFREMRGVNQFINILNAIEEGKETTTTEAVTKVVIDLLELARKRIGTTGNDLNETDIKINLLNDTGFENNDSVYEFNAINLMKRDIQQVTENNLNVTITEKINITNSSIELKDNVYLPLTSIIQEKQKELEDLLHVREKLIEILNLGPNSDYLVLNKSEKAENGSNSYISFYNVQIVPQTDNVATRAGIDLLDNYLKKLRKDIYVVIKDLISIQTITGKEDFPKDLKVLTHAIKHFMRNHTKTHKKHKLRSLNDDYDLRRHSNAYTFKNFAKNYLINILLLIDRNMPQSNALAPLSIKTRKIIKRVIKNNKLKDLSVLGFRVHDSNYNLTNDLKNIGSKWKEMTIKISNSSPWDRLHHMKLLQFVLDSDINKMRDALALIDFAHSRRMIALPDQLSDHEILRINNDLKSIHGKINEIIKLRSFNNRDNGIVKVFTVTKQNKKETFLRHIRDLLKNSKRDIINLLHRKVPKSEIVKQLAKKKLNEMTKKKLMEYERVMQKWQNNLDITRKRRSVFGLENLGTRIKNILPKYLRGKILLVII
ncbi:uncharacterized protein LOC114350428 [Ostrinia furnacalis]|uniref:uncharacterized protein LOC114350428 n=1 Tax=Ostrinia furnacalis TaxID=93504 RepID=UPI00103C5EA6|nr:uncharacterized protein LOC114350428 [Ostrinia furnacalis]